MVKARRETAFAVTCWGCTSIVGVEVQLKSMCILPGFLWDKMVMMSGGKSKKRGKIARFLYNDGIYEE